MNKPTHGGSRAGSGRKKKEPTSTLCIRVELQQLNRVRKQYGSRKLHKMGKDWVDSIDNGK